MNLTENEIKVIKAYKKDDYVSDSGWESENAGAWVKGFHEDAGMSGKTFSGTMASLSKKGIIWVDGESFGLTADGIKIASGV